VLLLELDSQTLSLATNGAETGGMGRRRMGREGFGSKNDDGMKNTDNIL